jgi:subtilisin family serine protease
MQPQKIAAGLLSAVHEYQREGRAVLVPRIGLMGLHPASGTPNPARVTVFLRVDPDADLTHLAAAGVEVNQAYGAVRTAILPLDSVDPVSDEPAIHRIIPSRVLRPAMDVAVPSVGVNHFWASSGCTGKGVIVGVVDTGIDPAHPAFATRILRIWDQTAPKPAGGALPYGRELLGAALAGAGDTQGHGTHVAGIAAGDDATFRGIAYEADLVVVKTDFDSTHIADAVRYVFQVAASLGRPAVVNLSLGGHFDAHDGTDPLSSVIDSESGPGRIVCCAAGNEGNDNIHAEVNVPPGGQVAPRFQVPLLSVKVAELNAWYAAGVQLEVAVQSPGGFVTPFQPLITVGSAAHTHVLPDAQITLVTAPHAPGQDHQILAVLRGPGSTGAVTSGTWRLFLRNPTTNSVRADVWALDGQSQVAFTGSSLSDSMKIGSPGTAAEAITVAAYTTRVQWTDGSSTLRSVGLKLREIADFSSEGPLRNGALKPDIAAPGAMIVSCSSSSAPVPLGMDVSPFFRVEAGTSMATPFVTGLVALLLQRNATLDPAGVKAKLMGASSIPGQPAGHWDPKWGRGLVDARLL